MELVGKTKIGAIFYLNRMKTENQTIQINQFAIKQYPWNKRASATSCASKLVFSSAANVVAPLRSCLKPEKGNMLLFLALNLNKFIVCIFVCIFNEGK